MTATQLIEALERAIREHGDLVVYCFDGLDPSDPCPVKSVEKNPGEDRMTLYS